MCLSVKMLRPQAVLAEGVHAGHEWAVVHNDIGYRCGYVKVEAGHPWHGKDWDKIDCEVHGGITFARADQPCDKGGLDNGWWVGFDCAHSGDAPDPELMGAEAIENARLFGRFDHGGYASIKGTRYVETECRNLCEQAQAALRATEPT